MNCRAFPALAALLIGGLALVAATRDEEAKKYADNLKSKDAKVRLTAAVELGKLGSLSRKITEPYTPNLIAALRDSDAKVRGEAAKTLGLIDPSEKKELIEKLIDILKTEKDETAREGQEMGLGELGATAEEAELKKMARDALLDARKKNTDSKREQKTIQAALILINGPKKKN